MEGDSPKPQANASLSASSEQELNRIWLLPDSSALVPPLNVNLPPVLIPIRNVDMPGA